MGAECEADEEMEQMLSRYVLNSSRCDFRNSFMGSIQASLVPKVVMFARPWRPLAIKVRVRRA